MKLFFYSLLFTLCSTVPLAGQSKKLTLQEIWSGNTFRQESVSGIRPMNDGLHYTTLKQDGNTVHILKTAYENTKTETTLFSSADYKLPGGKVLVFDEYTFSADESKLLVPTEFEPVYRHSGKSAFVIIDLKNQKADYLSSGKQLLAGFSPDGKKVAFVRDNNLFVKDLETGTETAITTDGKQNHIINGSTDWVYEEEFSFAKAFYWSPDSRRIAWLRFDESGVKEYSMPTYGSLYPGNYTFKYPKAGEDNSLVNAFVYDLGSRKTVKVKTSDDKNTYLPRVKWTHDGSALSVVRLNRHQNHLELLLADPATGDVRLLLEEKSKTYVDVHDHLTFLTDGKRFIWSSEQEGFSRLYLYGMDGKKINPITAANSDVTDFYGVDEKSGTVYYRAAAPAPMNRSIYSARLNGKGIRKLVESTGHVNPEFSKNFAYFILHRSKANEPAVYELYRGSGQLVSTLQDNRRLKDKLKEYDLSVKEFFSFTTSQGTLLNGWMIKPPDFDAGKKYPVFMTVYGGPGHNTVEDSWGGATHLWHHLLAQKGYIVVSVDNRGTGNRGEEFKKCTYKQLGKLETEDQIEAAQYLARQPYVDGSRIGIQGWSYGGYMSSLCITKGADVFKMAIAVAPVTNWRYYDSIYTERFMQTPEENAEGYDDNSPINHVARLKGKYLLIHGTADDNVHFQNAVEMVSALVRANKQFDVFYYPDKNHGIYGGNTRLHLYTLMTDYILENL